MDKPHLFPTAPKGQYYTGSEALEHIPGTGTIWLDDEVLGAQVAYKVRRKRGERVLYVDGVRQPDAIALHVAIGIYSGMSAMGACSVIDAGGCERKAYSNGARRFSLALFYPGLTDAEIRAVKLKCARNNVKRARADLASLQRLLATA